MARPRHLLMTVFHHGPQLPEVGRQGPRHRRISRSCCFISSNVASRARPEASHRASLRRSAICWSMRRTWTCRSGSGHIGQEPHRVRDGAEPSATDGGLTFDELTNELQRPQRIGRQAVPATGRSVSRSPAIASRPSHGSPRPATRHSATPPAARGPRRRVHGTTRPTPIRRPARDVSEQRQHPVS